MDVIYLITDTLTCKKYLGSKKNWKGEGTYFGSPCCSSSHPKYTDQQEWTKNVKERPDTFSFQILEQFENIDFLDLLQKENEWQKKYDVVRSKDFINAGYATRSTWHGSKHWKGLTYEQIYGRRREGEEKR